jgi:hypothetical protein
VVATAFDIDIMKIDAVATVTIYSLPSKIATVVFNCLRPERYSIIIATFPATVYIYIYIATAAVLFWQ